MIEQILIPLEVRAMSKSVLQNLIAIGEKGSAWICYDDKGKVATKVDESVSVPACLQVEVKALVAQPQFADIVFSDDTKRTMVSVELRRGRTIGEFEGHQRQLVVAFHDILVRHGLEDVFRIDPTQIAIDIENREVGKNRGARKFVELLEANGIEPYQFIGFGDSRSDYGMFEELKRIGKRARFVFVGGQEHLRGKNLDGVVLQNNISTLGR